MNKPKNAFDILMRKNTINKVEHNEPLIKNNSEKYDKYRMAFDGGSRGNPGPCGAGAVIYKNNKEFATVSHFISGKHSNNHAEYTAFILGLQKSLELGITHLYVEGDSKLVINQCTGKFKVKSPSLIPLNAKAMSLCKKFTYITLNHIKRNHNKRADSLANEAMDKNENNINL
jgi:ribonuclease HI